MNTFSIKSPKGNECRVGIRKEYDHDQLCKMKCKVLGAKWRIIWQSIGGCFSHREEWMDFISDKTPENVIDEMLEKYGKGEIWGFYEEIVTRA